LFVDEELTRAVRRESSLALQYWFGPVRPVPSVADKMTIASPMSMTAGPNAP
jgi:hypothetical protein